MEKTQIINFNNEIEIETIEQIDCLEDGSFIEIDLDKIEENIKKEKKDKIDNKK